MHLTPTGGTLDLGRPSPTADAMLLHRPTIAGDYTNGLPRFEAWPELCWLVGTARACNRTLIDSGELVGMIMGPQFEPWVTPITPVTLPGEPITETGYITAGEAVRFAQAAGDRPFLSMVAAESGSLRYGYYTTTGEPTFNTGNSFFVGRAVGFDNVSGDISVGHTEGVPSAPLHVRADGGSEALHVAWEHPASDGSAPVTSYLVTVRAADAPAILATRTVAADVTGVDLTLDPGDDVVDVEAANEYGVSDAASVAGTVKAADAAPRLAESGLGGSWIGMLGAGALLGGAGAALVLWRRRTGRA
jgi:hypothetical protein